MLIGLGGEKHEVNDRLMRYALCHGPVLVLDCANAANAHGWFHLLPDERRFALVDVMTVEVIYTLRDVLIIMGGLRAGREVIVTTFSGLFHYGDPIENRDVTEHLWELMKTLGANGEVIVGVKEDDRNARKYCDAVYSVKQWDTQYGAKG